MRDFTRIVLTGALLVLAICGVVIAAKARPRSAQASAASGTPLATAAPKKVEEQFKNIQILKGIPADQLIPAMQFIAASLGVECDFCHVEGAFEKDDKKPKETARKMMAMMFTINQENFDGHREVTCYSCHRGSRDPIATPIIGGEEPKTIEMQLPKLEGEAAKPTRPSADRIIDEYILALGGAKAIENVTSSVASGTIDFGGASYPIDVYTKEPGKRASFVHMPAGDNITAFNGQEGWLAAPKRPVHDMHGPDLDAAAMDADLHFATDLKRIFNKVEVEENERVDAHDCYFLIGQRENKPPVWLYFDKESGLLLRLMRYGETPLGRLPTQIDYSDYREVGGVKVPFRWTLARPGGRFTIQAKDIMENVEVPDSKFTRPSGQPTASAR